MIRRNYVYNITIQLEERRKFACGIVSVKSWLPKPTKAFRQAMDNAKSICDCEDNQVRVEFFARV